MLWPTINPTTLPYDNQPLDRKLRSLDERLSRLERRTVLADADVAKGRRLLADLLTLLARRLRDEDGV